MSIRLPDVSREHVLKYFEEVVYHNNLIGEYQALLPAAFPAAGKAKDRMDRCMNEIAMICRSDAAPPPVDAQPSLRARAESLLKELDGIKVAC